MLVVNSAYGRPEWCCGVAATRWAGVLLPGKGDDDQRFMMSSFGANGYLHHPRGVGDGSRSGTGRNGLRVSAQGSGGVDFQVSLAATAVARGCKQLPS